MTQIPLRTILELVGSAGVGRPIRQDLVRALGAVRASEEREIFQLLVEHRLQYLFWNAIKQSDLRGAFSKQFLNHLSEEYRTSLIRSAAFEMGLAQSSSALSRAKIEFIACKGAVLSQHYYPQRGLRRMHDLDYWLIEPDVDRCRDALLQVGFIERPEKALPDARNFIDSSGVVLDVHLQMSLFETRGFDLLELSQAQPNAGYRIFVPEAMIAHLLTHLLGHASQTGILICWLVDLALVMNRHELDVGKIRALLRDDGSWAVFLRIVRSFLELGWIDHDFALGEQLVQARLLNWESLARARRRSGWTGLRGKLRLSRTIVARPEGHAPLPYFSDLFWQPVDWLLEENTLTGGAGALLVRRSEG